VGVFSKHSVDAFTHRQVATVVMETTQLVLSQFTVYFQQNYCETFLNFSFMKPPLELK